MSRETSDPLQMSGVMVVFGADGDLAKRKLIPSLYNLAVGRYLPEEFAVIGLARTAMTTDEFRQKLSSDIRQFATSPVDAKLWDWLQKRIYYVTGEFQDPQAYQRLQETLKHVETTHGTGGNHLFYLATAPSFLL
jgi:Glucose-6-phosphate 1-dehydrogenase